MIQENFTQEQVFCPLRSEKGLVVSELSLNRARSAKGTLMHPHSNRPTAAMSAVMSAAVMPAALPDLNCRRIALVPLTICAVLLSATARLEASVVTYRFSGARYFSSGTFPGGTPTNFSGTVAYDTSTPGTSGGWRRIWKPIFMPDLWVKAAFRSRRTRAEPLRTDPNTTDLTYSVDTAIAGGPNLAADSLLRRAPRRDSHPPAGRTATPSFRSPATAT